MLLLLKKCLILCIKNEQSLIAYSNFTFKLPFHRHSGTAHLQLRDIHQRQSAAGIFQAGHQGVCGIQRSDAVNAGLNGGATDQEAVPGLIPALGGGVDDQIDLVAQDQVHDRR